MATAKNLVVCADGTWNRPEEDLDKDYPTNVLRFSRAIAPKSGNLTQTVFYDWGLGSYHSGLSAGAFGKGIHKNILDGYRFIVQNYKPNDNIYLFGFSRGAYTVRALSGLINNCGILKRQHAKHIARAWEIYKSPADKNHPNGEGAREFRTLSHQSRRIHFIGVWDTVGALGIPFSVMGLFDSNDEFYDTKMGSNVTHARHALAIDEQREDFEPTVWVPRPEVDLKQVWFAGVHSDVGGSYPPDKETQLFSSDIALDWMIREATDTGLKVEPYLKQQLAPDAGSKLHKSRTKVFRLRPPKERNLSPVDKASKQPIPIGMHSSVKERYEADSKYRPANLEKYLADLGGWPDKLER